MVFLLLEFPPLRTSEGWTTFEEMQDQMTPKAVKKVGRPRFSSSIFKTLSSFSSKKSLLQNDLKIFICGKER